MEGGFVLEDKPKVEKMAKDSTGASGRKMLADISNIQQKHSTLTQDKKSLPNSAIVKEKFIEQLQKENAALKKHLAEKSRIIDLSGTELHKLRVTLQKMQQQNLQLAQSNSQLLAEVNSGKDRLKDMQHQLGCKNGVLIAKQMELEGKRKTKTCQTNDVKKMKVSENEEKGVCNIDKEEQCNKSRRQKSKSLGSSVRNGQDKGVGDNGRRQSARFIKREEAKATEDLFDTDNVDLKEEEDRMQEDNNNNNNDSNCVVFVKKEEEEEEEEERRRRRSSISSRPSREAVKKIQSYKEMSINVKMRRTE
ncbi:SHUGOSHIN 1 isoform X2 [Lactuca sativa]|uniref:Shugoshin C-terminal domain-containing protein n=1 Tax=Lactuca sativa TaxID=4236 RepID=A0A9R1WSR9_LACSA|nr:SHUGOSHIN 1 isoform X2 [Lactuca sativa]KAJ0186756.1 hypothetical protein LSAT_V11C900485340 [Lactuca sativa]